MTTPENPESLVSSLFDRIESLIDNNHVSYASATREIKRLIHEYRSRPENTASLTEGGRDEHG